MLLVTAANPRPTHLGPEYPDMIDVDITLTIDGRTITGEVTLAPSHDGTLVGYGQPEQWMSGTLLDAMIAIGDYDVSDPLVAAIEAEARRAATAP